MQIESRFVLQLHSLFVGSERTGYFTLYQVFFVAF